MDIQRGDQVYYRGEVWQVIRVGWDWKARPLLRIRVPLVGVTKESVLVYPSEVQRVEQVR